MDTGDELERTEGGIVSLSRPALLCLSRLARSWASRGGSRVSTRTRGEFLPNYARITATVEKTRNSLHPFLCANSSRIHLEESILDLRENNCSKFENERSINTAIHGETRDAKLQNLCRSILLLAGGTDSPSFGTAERFHAFRQEVEDREMRSSSRSYALLGSVHQSSDRRFPRIARQFPPRKIPHDAAAHRRHCINIRDVSSIYPWP